MSAIHKTYDGMSCVGAGADNLNRTKSSPNVSIVPKLRKTCELALKFSGKLPNDAQILNFVGIPGICRV